MVFNATFNNISVIYVRLKCRTGRWFSHGTPVSSTNKTDHHDIIEILLKVALNAINQTNISVICKVKM
jgi:hypothetical protein